MKKRREKEKEQEGRAEGLVLYSPGDGQCTGAMFKMWIAGDRVWVIGPDGRRRGTGRRGPRGRPGQGGTAG